MPRLDPAHVAQPLQGGDGGHGHGRGLLKGQRRRLPGHIFFGHGNVFGEPAVAATTRSPNFIARLELRHVPADRINWLRPRPASDFG
jgi:hypothetical protein